MELGAISAILGVAIIVHRSEVENVIVDNTNNSNAPMIHLLYNGSHYDLITDFRIIELPNLSASEAREDDSLTIQKGDVSSITAEEIEYDLNCYTFKPIEIDFKDNQFEMSSNSSENSHEPTFNNGLSCLQSSSIAMLMLLTLGLAINYSNSDV